MRRASLRRGQPVPERGEPSVMSTMHASPPFINDTNANQFREMCWGCGSARAVLVVEREADTTRHQRPLVLALQPGHPPGLSVGRQPRDAGLPAR